MFASFQFSQPTFSAHENFRWSATFESADAIAANAERATEARTTFWRRVMGYS